MLLQSVYGLVTNGYSTEFASCQGQTWEKVVRSHFGVAHRHALRSDKSGERVELW